MSARRIITGLLLAAAAGLPAGLCAQSTEVVAPPAPDADALAAELRVLAASPNDLPALLRAGELALKLGDPTAAAAFFARAERVDPRSGRQKAGTAATLLRLERPGEALALFAQAEALGYEPSHYASDRALAYDLTGDQPRAQRDYALALRQDADDPETLRRYALSLGISGEREPALEQIDKLLRKSDRAAWRVRAFVLAMTGDVPGAEKIAASMLPGNMASSLSPFFARLPSLNAVDRAWAVHFGELGPSPARVADARLAPRLEPLAVEPRAPVRTAALAPAPRPDRADRRAGRAAVPAARTKAATAPPVAVAAARPVPVPEALRPPPPAAVSAPIAAPPAPAAAPPVAVAAAAPPPVSAPPPVAVVTQPPAQGPSPAGQPRAAVVAKAAPPPSPPASGEAAPMAAATPPRADPPPAAAAPAARAATVPVAVAARSRALKPPIKAAPTGREGSILERIIANVRVPASELAAPGAKRRGGTAPAEPPAEAAKRKGAKVDAKADAKAESETATAAERRRRKGDSPADRKKGADPAKADPVRYWVQVAGGAREADLPKAWAATRAKAPDAFRGRAGYATPLRATNRVLTGPFKSEDEAQAFVNTLGRQGISAFVFTSAAGQKIDKLPAR